MWYRVVIKHPDLLKFHQVFVVIWLFGGFDFNIQILREKSINTDMKLIVSGNQNSFSTRNLISTRYQLELLRVDSWFNFDEWKSQTRKGLIIHIRFKKGLKIFPFKRLNKPPLLSAEMRWQSMDFLFRFQSGRWHRLLSRPLRNS